MLFAVICDDCPDGLEIRLANRPAHVGYLKESGVVVQAGPFLDDEGKMRGSLVVIDVPNREAAESWAECDPYGLAGLFERVEIRAWNKVIG